MTDRSVGRPRQPDGRGPERRAGDAGHSGSREGRSGERRPRGSTGSRSGDAAGRDGHAGGKDGHAGGPVSRATAGAADRSERPGAADRSERPGAADRSERPGGAASGRVPWPGRDQREREGTGREGAGRDRAGRDGAAPDRTGREVSGRTGGRRGAGGEPAGRTGSGRDSGRAEREPADRARPGRTDADRPRAGSDRIRDGREPSARGRGSDPADRAAPDERPGADRDPAGPPRAGRGGRDRSGAGRGTDRPAGREPSARGRGGDPADRAGGDAADRTRSGQDGPRDARDPARGRADRDPGRRGVPLADRAGSGSGRSATDGARGSDATRVRPSGPGSWSIGEQSLISTVLGVHPLVAVGVAALLTAAGVLVDLFRIGTLGTIFTVCYLTGCVLGVAWVRRNALFWPMVVPPLLMAAAVPIVVLAAGSPRPGAGIAQRLLQIGAPLVNGFPIMAWTTGLAVALGLFRLATQRERKSVRSAPAAARGAGRTSRSPRRS